MAHAAVDAVRAVSTIRVLRAGAAVVAIAVGGPDADLNAYKAEDGWRWGRRQRKQDEGDSVEESHRISSEACVGVDSYS